MKTTRPMTKSPRAVAREALRLAQEALPAYASKFSRQDYTQHQLFAILALKTFFKADYRGVVQLLHDFAELRQELGLRAVPHYSTLCHAAKRLLDRSATSFSEPDCRHRRRTRTHAVNVGGAVSPPRREVGLTATPSCLPFFSSPGPPPPRPSRPAGSDENAPSSTTSTAPHNDPGGPTHPPRPAAS